MTFATAEAIAPLIGFDTAAAFLAARARLERDHGFPLPMPTCLRPLKWRLDEVEAWAAMQGTPNPPAPVIGGPNVILLAEARRG